MSELFAPSREESNTKARKFRCGASIGLSLCLIIGVWLSMYRALCPQEIHCYVCLCDLVESFMCVARGTIESSDLLARVERFLAAFEAAFGAPCMTPKFHWLLHFKRHWDKFKVLTACFVHERKHKMVKRYCENILNTVQFERTVLHEVVFSIIFSTITLQL